MSTLDWFCIASIAALVLLPPKYDPAVRIKEWQEKRREGVRKRQGKT